MKQQGWYLRNAWPGGRLISGLICFRATFAHIAVSTKLSTAATASWRHIYLISGEFPLIEDTEVGMRDFPQPPGA